MNVKPTLELDDNDFNGIFSILGEAWRADGKRPKQYDVLVEQMKTHATQLAKRAFLFGLNAHETK